VSQVLDVEGNLFPRDGFRLNAVAGTEAQVIVETAAIGVYCVGGELQVGLPLEPISCEFVLSYQWILFPADLGHGTPPKRRRQILPLLDYHLGVQVEVTTLILTP